MHEFNNTLEAHTNLTYLLTQEGLPAEATEKLTLMEEQSTVLTAFTRRSVSFHKDRRISKGLDLVAFIASVRKLHDPKASNPG